MMVLAKDKGELAEAVVYKGTTLPHIVVKRRCRLYENGFSTGADKDRGSSSSKQWVFHKKCTLEPPTAEGIKPHERHVRKAGPLSAVAAYRDKRALKLYCFKIEWPEQHSPNSGSSVELGFDSIESAREWHGYVAARILAQAGPSQHRGSTTAEHHQRSRSSGHNHHSSNGGSSSNAGSSGHMCPAPELHTAPSLSTFNSVVSSANGSPLGSPDASQPASAKMSRAPSLGSHSVGGTPYPANGERVSSSVRAAVLQMQHGKGRLVDDSMQRWVPYKHSNGMAIYYRHAPGEDDGPGRPSSGEYMMSTTIQASPQSCVDKITGKSAQGQRFISIASFMEVLDEEDGLQVRHLVFEAQGQGVAASVCAPREAFLHEVVVSYEEGVYAWLFSSIPDEEIKPEWLSRAGDSAQKMTKAAAASDPSGRWFKWTKPVRAHVTGAMTFSALEGASARGSSQTLATLIVKADFGGWISPASYFHRCTRALGLREALMERMMMAIITLKDEVEFGRFRTRPFELLTQLDDNAGSQPEQPQQQEQEQQLQEGQEAEDLDGRQMAASALLAHMARPRQLWQQLQTSRGSTVSEETEADVTEPDGTESYVTGDGGGTSDTATGDAAVARGQGSMSMLDSLRARTGGGSNSGSPSSSRTASPAKGVRSRAAASAASMQATVAAQQETLRRGKSICGPVSVGGAPPACPYSDAQLAVMAKGTMPAQFWEALQSPGEIYSTRGANYLRDKQKAPASAPRYRLTACDLVATHQPIRHVGRFLPSVRCNPAPFSFVVNLIVPSNPILHLVMVYSSDRHPDSLGPCPDDPSDAGDEWTPFDLSMSRFLHATDEERDSMFKIIPHCAKGSWIIVQSVGTTPVILGRKVKTAYTVTPRYIEVDIDLTTNTSVSYIVKMVQGATKSMVIDHAYLLEGQYAHELPETLIGACRFKHLDMSQYTYVDVTYEIPMCPVATASSSGAACNAVAGASQAAAAVGTTGATATTGSPAGVGAQAQAAVGPASSAFAGAGAAGGPSMQRTASLGHNRAVMPSGGFGRVTTQ